jgi:hypothetical protein
MKINEINIHGGNVNFAEKIDKIIYNQNLGISKVQFSELINAIKSLPIDQLSVLEKDFYQISQVRTDEEKTPICQRIKIFLINNGIPVAHSLTASAIFELVKMFH